jgi:hypothetical protein
MTPKQAERDERRARETVAKGTPLSVRIRWGKPKLLKKAAENRLCISAGGSAQGLTAEQVAREVVSDGQRITVVTITSFEVAFEIGTPNLVGCRNDGSRFAGMTNEPTMARLLDQAMAGENVANGSASGPLLFRLAVAQDLE